MYKLNGEYLHLKHIKLLYFCIFILFFIPSLRLWFLQILKGDQYYYQSTRNSIRYDYIYAPRGIIRDKNFNIIADNLPAFAIGIIREDCKNLCEYTVSYIAELLNRDKKEFLDKLRLGKKKVEPFKPLILERDLTIEDLSKIEVRSNDLPGIVIIPYPKRYYPYGKIGAHVIGYVGEPSEEDLKKYRYLIFGDVVGKTGLERSYEEVLRGKKGKKRLEVNARGRTLHEEIIENPIIGNSIQSTLDIELEKFIFKRMENQRGATVVMNPYNGNVLALVSTPSYDINKMAHGLKNEEWIALIKNKAHPLQNRGISSAYPPGSVFKLVVGLLALEKNVIGINDKVYCPGFYKLGNRVFRCWKKYGHGWVDFKRAIKESCDVYFYKLGEQLGIDAISEFAKKCGFGSKTNIFLNGERSGLIPSREWKYRRFGTPWQKGETLNTAIGQGYVLVTPIQVAKFISAIVNGGRLLRPRISFIEPVKMVGSLPASKRSINTIKEAMIETVNDKRGTAHILKINDIIIGAKTGTAQVISNWSEEDRKKDTKEIEYLKRDHAWMAAFGIKDKKAYVVVTIIEHGGHGASGAGPIVKDIFKFLFNKQG